MRRNLPRQRGDQPLVPGSAYLLMIMLIAALASGAIFVASTKVPQQAKVYLAEDFTPRAPTSTGAATGRVAAITSAATRPSPRPGRRQVALAAVAAIPD
jgi:hypothetical protein